MAGGCGCEGGMEQLGERIEQLDHQLNGNGQEGVMQRLGRVERWQAAADGAADARGEADKAHHRANTWRLNAIMLLLTAALVWLAIFHR